MIEIKPVKKVRFKDHSVKLTPNLVRMIANLVYEAQAKEYDTNGSERVVTSDYASFAIEPSKFRTKADFPYNMSRVCRSWWNAIRKVPNFWTDFTINVAEDPARILHSLRLSQDLSLAVCIITKVENPVGSRAIVRSRITEKRRMNAVIDALQPHLWRCTSIVIRVNWESSLPLLSRLILPDSTTLRILICQCRLIEAIADPESSKRTHNWHADEKGWSNDHVVHAPDLPVCAYEYESGTATAMAITGRQYSDAVIHAPGVFESMARRVDHLALSYFSFEPPVFLRGAIDQGMTEEHLLTVHGFFQLLSKLRPREKPGLGLYLSFMRTNYTPYAFLDQYDSPGTSLGFHHTITNPASFNFISFNTVSRSVFWEINQNNAISLSSTSFCRFRNCVLVSPFGAGATLFGVILEGMEDPVSVCYALFYIRYTTSIFRACKGLNDHSARVIGLSRLSRFGFPLKNRTRELADCLQAALFVVDCDTLTDQGLMRLVNGYTLETEGESLLRMLVYRNRNKAPVSREVAVVLRSLKDVHLGLRVSEDLICKL